MEQINLLFEFAFGKSFLKKGTSQLIPSSLLETIVAFAVVWLEKFVRFHRLENSPGQLTYTVLGTECNFVPKIQVYKYILCLIKADNSADTDDEQMTS